MRAGTDKLKPMYSDELLKSALKAEEKRKININKRPERLSSSEKNELLYSFHPDYIENEFGTIDVGKNKGEKAPLELLKLLYGKSIVPLSFDLSNPSYDTDVLIIGGGGAGASAAIEARNSGASVIIATKLRLGDANTIMAEGGIQAADKENDSPSIHFLDAYGGGRFDNKKDLLKELVTNAPDAILWLGSLGVEFDRDENGEMSVTHGGGTSRKRMHAARDVTGKEIMRTLRDEVLGLDIKILEFAAASELLTDENGNVSGAVLVNMETGELFSIRAKTVILAAGGAGRLHYQGFPTSNHYGATADGLILSYRAGANLLYQDSLQYHPTGALYPIQLLGALVTEKVRSLGAALLNCDGDPFINPLETRDVVAAAIIKECKERKKGVKTPDGFGALLDTPMIEIIHGEGTIEKRLPAMLDMFLEYNIDIRKEPVAVYPTLHYQNGGVEINPTAETSVKNLFAAGEVTGGVHGRNRLMGNSLLDCIVFGRIAGKNAALRSKEITNFNNLTLNHLKNYQEELKKAGVENNERSPKLLNLDVKY